MDQRIKFRHLQTFIEVARHVSIGKAAEALSISQPAVTHTIRDLEDILGVKLVEKEGRGIRITRVGRIFLHHAGASVASARAGVDAVRLQVRAPRPPVRIGALPTVSATLMPAAVKKYLAMEAGGQLKVVTGENRVLLEQLRLGELDLVIGRLAAPETMASLSFEPLYTDAVIFAVRPGHPLLLRASFSLREIDGYPVLMPTRNSIIRPFAERFLIANGISELSETIETVSDSFGRAFTAQSDAVWIISSGVIQAELEAGLLQTLPLDTSETTGQVGLTTRAGVAPNASADLFMAVVRDVGRSLRNRPQVTK